MSETPSQERIGSDAPAAHPNYKSYLMSSHGVESARSRGATRRLQRITLYSVKRNEELGDAPYPGAPDGARPVLKVIDTTLFKKCQYNPPELELDLAYAPVAPEEAEVQGGKAGELQMGVANTSLDLLFSREQETHSGRQHGSRFSEYSRLGVAKDILDVYGVVMGDKTMLEANDQATISELTSKLTDLVSEGSPLLQAHRIAIAYSRDFIVFGLVTALSFRFVKFNHMMIPTVAYMRLSVDVHNLANKSLVNTSFVGTDTVNTDNTTTSSSGTESSVPSGAPPNAQSSTGWGGGNRPI